MTRSLIRAAPLFRDGRFACPEHQTRRITMTGITTINSTASAADSVQQQIDRARKVMEQYTGSELPTLNIAVGDAIAELIADLYHLAEHHRVGPDPIGYVLHFAGTFYRADLTPRDDDD